MKFNRHAPAENRSAHGRAGFSLVEVIISVGIVATVMLGLVGVMPVGLATIQEAQHNASKARIIQEIISDLQAADWSGGKPNPDVLQLQDDLVGEKNIRLYDAQGARINRQQGKAVANEAPKVPIYAAYVEIPVINGDNPVLMNVSARDAYKYLKLLNIYVENTPGGRAPDFKNAKRTKFVNKYPFLLSNMGSSASVRNNE